MRFHQALLFLLLLPLTLVLDLILFGLTRSCPSCSSFSQFVQTEGALSFPLVVGLLEWLEQLLSAFGTTKK